MDINNILEQIIAGVVSIILGAIITWFFNKILKRRNGPSIDKQPSYFDPVTVLIFITSLFGIATFFCFIFNWQPFNMYLGILTAVFCLLTIWAYDNQCPKCGKLGKVFDHEETLKEEERPYRYQNYTIYQYPDGTLKEKRYTGDAWTEMETWQIVKKYYKCKYCNNHWDITVERNIDEGNRPKPTIVTVKYPNSDI